MFVVEKNRLEIAKRLGIKVKANSDTPGIFVNTGNDKRKLGIEELFPELIELKEYSFSINYNNVSVVSDGKEVSFAIPDNQTFTKSELLVGAS